MEISSIVGLVIKQMPLILAFIAGSFGSITSIIILFLQLKANEKRGNIRLASELAIEDHHSAFEMVESKFLKGSTKRYALYPISSYFYYHLKVIEAASCKRLNSKTIMRIARESDKFDDVIEKITKLKKGN